MCEFSRLRQFHDYASLRYLYAGWKREERILNFAAPGRAAREGKSHRVRSKQLEHGGNEDYRALAPGRASARGGCGQPTIKCGVPPLDDRVRLGEGLRRA